MTAALLSYRPPSVRLLANVLAYELREEAKRRFIGNTLSMLLKVTAPKLERESYADFAARVENNPEHRDNRTAKEIIEDIKSMLRKE